MDDFCIAKSMGFMVMSVTLNPQVPGANTEQPRWMLLSQWVASQLRKSSLGDPNLL